MIKEDIIGKEFLQNCGDTLIVLEKTNLKAKDNHHYLYKIRFIKYPYEKLVTKSEIIRKTVVNPEIERIEFVEKIWPQNCGDSVRILEKVNGKGIWKVIFIKYPYEKITSKKEILLGSVRNPRIEEEEFMNKIWPQNCGDSVKILRKFYSKEKKRSMYEVEFIKYPYRTIIHTTTEVKTGEIFNKNLPYCNKENFRKYINKHLKNFDNTISISLFLSNELLKEGIIVNPNTIRHLIYSDYKFEDIINVYQSEGESILRNFCLELNNSTLLRENCSLLGNGYGIDIYIPDLNLGIEYNGDYWHSIKNKKDRNYHLKKSLLAQEKGIKLIHIWENEWIENQDIIKNWLKDYIFNKENNLYKKDGRVDLSKHPEFLNKRNIEPEIILREGYKVYNCGYYDINI